MDHPPTRLSKLLPVLILAVCTAIGASRAADWTSTADGDWHDSGNWSGGVPNAQDATANFTSNITGDIDINLDSPATVGSISFADGADDGSGYNSFRLVGSNALTMDVSSGNPSITASRGTGNEIAVDINTDTHELVVDVPNSGDKLTFSGSISGSGGLTKLPNPGTVEFTGDNSGWSGTKTLRGGRYGIGHDNAFGTGSLEINAGTLYALDDVSVDNVVTDWSGNPTGIDFDGTNGNSLEFTSEVGVSKIQSLGPGALTLRGNLSGGGKITANQASGRINFYGDNSITPDSIRDGITVGIGHDHALGNTANTMEVVRNVTLTSLDAAHSLDQTFEMVISTFTINGDDHDLTLTGQIKDGRSGARTGGLVKEGTSTLTLTGNNTWSGGTTVNAGTLVAAHDNALGTGSVDVNGGVLATGPGVTIANGINWSGGTTLAGSGTYQRSDSWSLPADFTISPGTSPGNLVIDAGSGNLIAFLDSTDLMMELASDSSFDSLSIIGNAELDGELYIDLLGDYRPARGQTFDLLTADSLTDSGLALAGPYAGKFTWQIVPGSDTLQITSQLPEPTAGALVLLAAVLGLGLRPRR